MDPLDPLSFHLEPKLTAPFPSQAQRSQQLSPLETNGYG